MNDSKIGQLILQLRKEKGLTQQKLANQLNVTNKAVSKWECGNGVPDVSLWEKLSEILGADLLKLLQGELKLGKDNPGTVLHSTFISKSKEKVRSGACRRIVNGKLVTTNSSSEK